MGTESSQARAGMDGELAEALVRSRRFFTRAEVSDDLRTLIKTGGAGSGYGPVCTATSMAPTPPRKGPPASSGHC